MFDKRNCDCVTSPILLFHSLMDVDVFCKHLLDSQISVGVEKG